MQAQQLTLYQFDRCPFCARVRETLTRLQLDIELRDVLSTPAFNDELRAATGRTTVPCLRIERPEGLAWMHESADIIAFLEEHFAGQSAG